MLPVAERVVADPEEPQRAPAVGRLPLVVIVGLTSALLVSDAVLVCLSLGQFGIFVSMAIVAGLRARGDGRPVLAGVWLALATVKVTTMLPFMLLFLHRRHLRTWISLAATTLALCLATGSLTTLPDRVLSLVGRVGELESPGKVNDYSFDGPRSENMLGFDHAYFRLGLRDRWTIRCAQLLTLAALGGWIAYLVLKEGCLPWGAACSLVALYAVVFLYHRAYDTVVLAVPLVYSVGRLRSASGSTRWLFAFCALAVLLVWCQDVEMLRSLQERSLQGGLSGWLIQAAVLPYATWLVVLTMAALVIAVRRSATPSPEICS
jgi:hypothetical protein